MVNSLPPSFFLPPRYSHAPFSPLPTMNSKIMKALFPPNTQQIFRTSSQPCSLCGGLLPSRPLRLTRKGSGTFLCMEFTAGQRILHVSSISNPLHTTLQQRFTPACSYTLSAFLHYAHWDFQTPMSMLSNKPRAALFLLCHYYKPLTTFIPNSSQAFASRPRPAALSLATKCSTQCAANLIPSPADSLALVKPCNRFYLPHFGVG